MLFIAVRLRISLLNKNNKRGKLTYALSCLELSEEANT